MSAALLAAATSAIQAHTLDGIVKDNKTGEPLIGTVIRVKELPNVSTTTGLDGTFTLYELPDKGKVTIIVSYMSYKTREMVVDVAKDFSKDGKGWTVDHRHGRRPEAVGRSGGYRPS